MSASFRQVERDEEVETLAHMAHHIWNEYWPAIIGQEQTDYMVEKFQSLNAIRADIADNGYEYWFIMDNGDEAEGAGKTPRIVGYTGGHVEPETNRFFISKIYLLKEHRGRGFCSAAVRFYDELCRTRGLSAMYLTVNKHNELGVRAYKGNGFKIIEDVITDIGDGYVMDDYIMERPVR